MTIDPNHEGRVVLVTGAARGIGRGLAERFSQEGARIAVADIDSSAAEEVAADLSAVCETAAFHLDVSDETSVQAVIAGLLERWDRLDVLCANAGIFPSAPLEDVTVADWDRVLSVNLTGLYLCIKHAVAPMRRQQSGRIVVTSSITGPVTGVMGLTHYGASKAGQLGLIRSAALEVAGDGITINAVLPGNVRTPGWGTQTDEYIDAAERSVPVGRLAEPADIAHAAYFFADQRSDYITGQTLIVDGGQTLPEVPLQTSSGAAVFGGETRR